MTLYANTGLAGTPGCETLDWKARDCMAATSKPDTQPDWTGIARSNRFRIPSDELGRLVAVLEPLVSDCREAFDEDLGLLDPVGTFLPDRT